LADTFLLKVADLTTVNATTLYTVPATDEAAVPPVQPTTSIIKSIRVANDHSSDNIDITLTITRSSAVYAIETLKTINAKTSSEILSMPLVANEGDIIKATAATADRLHVLLSVLEIT
jgi:hypothetical protein|tara:strand:- start:7 stop:360 length:354 start_codon:yes stop_codon:yes gene_type:complete